MRLFIPCPNRPRKFHIYMPGFEQGLASGTQVLVPPLLVILLFLFQPRTFIQVLGKWPEFFYLHYYMDRVKRIWYLSPMRAAKVQASLRIRAVSPEPSLLTHTSSESRGTFRQKARSLAPLNGWACAVKICHDGMLEDTNSLDGAHIIVQWTICKWSSVQVKN